MSVAETTDGDPEFDSSPALRSCINLGKTEPCVKKALQLLQQLRDQVQNHPSTVKGCGRHAGTEQTLAHPSDQGACPKDSDYSTAAQDLCVEGRSAGPQRSSSANERTAHSGGGLDWNTVIKRALDLVMRMEDDTQETLRKLSQEKERVHHFTLKHDMESKRRLSALESAVQAVYGSSAENLKELHSTVEKERKELSEVLCGLSVVDVKHTQLKKEEAELLHNSSLLEEKISDEKEKIEQIVQLQRKTSDEVAKEKVTLKQMVEQQLLSQKKADANCRERDRKCDSARKRLQRTREELKHEEERTEMLQAKIHRLQGDIKEACCRTQEYEDSAPKKTFEFEHNHSKVCALQEVCNKLEIGNKQAKDHKKLQEAEWQKECESLQKVNAQHKDTLERAKCNLQKLKDKREEIYQENDRLTQEIGLCKKQQEDDKKAVERGNNELIRLQKQLELSCAEFTKLRELNHRLSQHLEEEKAQTGSEEYKLKVVVDGLQRNIRRTDNAINKLEVQEKEDRQAGEKLEVQAEAMKERLGSTVKNNAAIQRLSTREVEELESTSMKKGKAVEHLQREIAVIQVKYDYAKQTMGLEVEELERTAVELQNDLEQRNEKYEGLRAREELLQGRIQESNKAIVSTQKIKSEVREENMELQQRVDELSEQVSRGREEEHSLEQKLKEVVEFREEAQKKFVQYTEQRQRHMRNLKSDMYSYLDHNALLRKKYELLQGQYLALKSKMCEDILKQKDVKDADRDMHQLEYVQSQLSSHLRTYIEYTSAKYTNKLLFCQAVARANHISLLNLQSDLREELKADHRLLQD